jgi:hypothetical protein
MIRFLVGILFFTSLNQVSYAQIVSDTTIKKNSIDSVLPVKKYVVIDSAALARESFIADSLTYYFIKPDPERANPYFEQLVTDFIIADPYLLTLPKSIKIVNNNYGLGLFLKKSPQIFIYTFLMILTFFGIVRVVFDKELKDIFKAFYNDRLLAQINKDDNSLFSWQFLFLFLILSLSTGLFIGILLFRFNGNQNVIHMNTFLILTLLAFVFFALKIFILKFIGYVFLIQKLTKDYINIIYLTYFNSLFLLLPITLCLILIDINQKNYIINTLLVLFSVIFGVQFIRIAINILLNYRLSKFYLILYLCALEICPLILFAKTINTSL